MYSSSAMARTPLLRVRALNTVFTANLTRTRSNPSMVVLIARQAAVCSGLGVGHLRRGGWL